MWLTLKTARRPEVKFRCLIFNNRPTGGIQLWISVRPRWLIFKTRPKGGIQVRISVKVGYFILKNRSRDEFGTKFNNVQVTYFKKPPEGRKSRLNFSQVWWIIFKTCPKGCSKVRISIQSSCFILKTVRRAEVRYEIKLGSGDFL